MLTTLLTKLYGGYLMDVNDLLVYAIDESMRINKDEIFLIKDLFKGYEWNRIPKKDRLLLGTLFLNYVKKEGTHIVPYDKTTSGQQRYKYI